MQTGGVEPEVYGARRRLVIVCGLPGAGKTTLARRIETDYSAVRMCPDEWMACLGIDIFDAASRARIEQLQWDLTQQLLKLDVTVVIEWGTWGRDERDRLREGARALGAAVELRLLDAPLAVLWRRLRDRDMERRAGHRALTRNDLESYAASFERPTKEELALFDPPLRARITSPALRRPSSSTVAIVTPGGRRRTGPGT